MARVRATIRASGVGSWAGQDPTWWASAETDLLGWITQILDAVMASDLDNGLVRNYLDNDGSVDAVHTFGEISGSAMFASVIYRLADELGPPYVKWADGIRETLNGVHRTTGQWVVSQEGAASPAIDPLAWGGDAVALSPEGQAFVVMMYSAWRDCILAGVCSRTGGMLRSNVETKREIVHGRRDLHRKRRTHQ